MIIFFLTWLLFLHRLGAQSLWYDEGYSVFVARLPLREILHWMARDFTPPLYNSLLALWLPLAGWTEFAARFLSVWAGTLMVAAMVRLGRDLHSRLAGFLAGLLAASSPFYVWYSQDARMYMPQALFGLLGTLFLLRALKSPARRRLWAGLALADALALYTHTTSGFLLIFHALVILAVGILSRRPAVLKRGGLALLGAALTWLPWLLYALPFLGKNAGYWAGQLNWQFVLSGAFRGFVTGGMMGGTAATVALWAWGVACLAGVLALLILPLGHGRTQKNTDTDRKNPCAQPVLIRVPFLCLAGRRQVLFFLLTYFAVPVAAMAILFKSVPKFSPRYLILASPPLFLLSAIGAAALLRRAGWRRVLGAALIAAPLTTAGLGLRNLYYSPAYAKSDFRTAARIVREQMGSDETVLLVPGHTFPVWQYYFGADNWTPLPDDPILDVRHVLHYRNTVDPLNGALAGRSGVWLVEWEPWVVDPTDLVAHLLAQVGEEIPLAEEPIGLRLRHYRLRTSPLVGGTEGGLPLPLAPAVPPPVDAALDLPLALVGCALPEQTRGDGQVEAACYWEAQGTLPLHLSVSARLVDTSGVEWGRADSAISGSYLVAGRWPTDELVLGWYSLRSAPGIPPGDFYTLQLRVYEPNGVEHGAVTAGPVTIARPTAPFTGALSTTPARLGGLALEATSITPERVLPGGEVTVEAEWRVAGPFHEPYLAVEGTDDKITLLPQPGATGAWQVGDRYRTVTRVPVSPYALGGPTHLWATSEDGEISLGTVNVAVTRTFALPPEAQPTSYRLGDSIFLTGTQAAVTGESVQVVLYWQAETFVERSYTVFLHLAGPDGQVYAQADSVPQEGLHPTTHWLPGEIVADQYRLEIPAVAPPGEYRLLAGLYDLLTLERLPVSDGAGERVADDAIPVGVFELGGTAGKKPALQGKAKRDGG